MTGLTCTCGPLHRELLREHGLPHLSHRPSYVKRKYDMAASYREAGMTVWADHCPGCGKWAHVIAGNNGADDVGWSRTICEHCGIKEVETEWVEGKGWISKQVPVSAG